MTTRNAIHALVDELDEDELEAAKDALEELHADDVVIADDDRDELIRRAADCSAGDVVNARAFLAALREEPSDS
jgi:hypothetical protein